ncbi:MAG: hypothetical protein GXP24_06775 [Planctomycetes bacterium]|nr:hypothetical protein [Planctomycetota bacterium]
MDSDQKNGLEQANDSLLDEAEALIWALLDDSIESANLKRLESLLQENEQVRQRYISCVQMHADLNQHFAELPNMPSSPVLGSLGDLQPGTGMIPPVFE